MSRPPLPNRARVSASRPSVWRENSYGSHGYRTDRLLRRLIRLSHHLTLTDTFPARRRGAVSITPPKSGVYCTTLSRGFVTPEVSIAPPFGTSIAPPELKVMFFQLLTQQGFLQ